MGTLAGTDGLVAADHTIRIGDGIVRIRITVEKLIPVTDRKHAGPCATALQIEFTAGSQTKWRSHPRRFVESFAT